MINILYSLLVAGSDPITESTIGYRRHSHIPTSRQTVCFAKDPEYRSVWANYIIAVARISSLYTHIEELDTSNTYNTEIVVPEGMFSILELPSDKHVKDAIKGIPKWIRDQGDMSSIYDRVCLFCIGLIKGYTII